MYKFSVVCHYKATQCPSKEMEGAVPWPKNGVPSSAFQIGTAVSKRIKEYWCSQYTSHWYSSHPARYVVCLIHSAKLVDAPGRSEEVVSLCHGFPSGVSVFRKVNINYAPNRENCKIIRFYKFPNLHMISVHYNINYHRNWIHNTCIRYDYINVHSYWYIFFHSTIALHGSWKQICSYLRKFYCKSRNEIIFFSIRFSLRS